jgi:transposase
METANNSTSAFHPRTVACVLGIDVSKDSLDACLMQIDARHTNLTVPNTPKGVHRLLAWASKQVEKYYVCLEATNVYGKCVAEASYLLGLPVSVVNPRQTHAFAQARLARTKTDPIDGELIAHFARAMMLEGRLPRFEPLSAALQSLQALVRYREALVDQRVQVTNRLGTTEHRLIQKADQKILRTIEQQIEKIEAEIEQQIVADPSIKESYEILTSIPGVGIVTASVLLSELQMDRFDSPKQVAAAAGITPRARHSGTKTPSSQPISKMGNARIRKALYMAAVNAMQYNETIKTFAARLLEKGKAGKVVVVAVMRKLIHISFALMKNHQRFQPDHKIVKLAAN